MQDGITTLSDQKNQLQNRRHCEPQKRRGNLLVRRGNPYNIPGDCQKVNARRGREATLGCTHGSQ